MDPFCLGVGKDWVLRGRNRGHRLRSTKWCSSSTIAPGNIFQAQKTSAVKQIKMNMETRKKKLFRSKKIRN